MKNEKIKIIVSLFFITIILSLGCIRKEEENNNSNVTTLSGSVTVSGSTSVGPLMEKESVNAMVEKI